jgi:hypothetical protein
MKSSNRLFADIPVNWLIVPVLLVFLTQAFLVMFYNDNNLTFSSLNVFTSLAKGADIADANFLSMPRGITGLKEINGFLYPLVVSLVYKICGKYNLIRAVYVLSVFSAFLIAVLFYKSACAFLKKEIALAATAVFLTAAPAAMGLFSGGDVELTMLLLAFNAYFILCRVQEKKYAAAWVTSLLLLLTSWTGAVFGLATASYLLVKMNEKALAKNYNRNMAVIYAAMFVAFSAILGGIFIDKLTPAFFDQTPFLDTRTFQADTFFKDGFLWSKAMPPFFALFFYMAFFTRLPAEMRSKKAGFMTYAAMLTLAALLMEFFATFSAQTETALFMPPFYFIAVLAGVAGISDLAGFISKGRSGIFGADNILRGVLVFVIAVNFVFLFNKSVERDNNIRHISGNNYVEKFTER